MRLFSHPIKGFCCLSIFLLLTSALGTTHGAAQQHQERFLLREKNRDEPLRIKAIKGKKGAITVGQKFLDDDDWLKGLSFNLENISGKNIIYLELELDFPKSNDDPPPLLYSIKYGLRPLLDGSLAADAPPQIKPGEEIELGISESEHENLQRLLAQLGYPKSVKQVVFTIGAVIFDDLLMWNTGRLMRRDPDDPKRWVPLNRLPKTSLTPKLNFIGGSFLNPDANFFLNHSSKNSGIRFNETYLSTRRLVQGPTPDNECGDFDEYVTICSSNCDVKFHGRPIHPEPCGYCYYLITRSQECEQAAGMPNGNCSTLTKPVKRAKSCGLFAGNCSPYYAPPTEESIKGGSTDLACTTCPCSPVLLDLQGNGFNLTDVVGGVNFDLNGDGLAERRSWTSAGSDDAWLALDRNGDGQISDGTELFGSATVQPHSSDPNGFRALAEFDKQEKGGNSDGVIDNQDAVYNSLRVWQDTNHDGVSETSELSALPSRNVEAVSLNYRVSKKRDRHGNEFRYRAKVYGAMRSDLGRWAWDVFLLQGNN